MAVGYQILDVNGDTMVSAKTMRACAVASRLGRTTAAVKRLADQQCAAMNDSEGGSPFRVARVSDLD